MTHSATLEIDLDAIAANWRALDGMHEGATAGVVKANAYGLGAEYVAPKLFAAGCRHFFTAHLAEALAIRDLVPGALLGVLHGILPGEEPAFAEHAFTPVLGSLAELARWRDEAKRQDKKLPAILHLDTGMARLGFSSADCVVIQNDPALLDGLRFGYLMTHLISAETPEDPVNQRQRARFEQLRAYFPSGLKTSLANSSGMFLGAAFDSDLARPGAALYGLNPSHGRGKNPLRPVVRLIARILQIRDVAQGETVGYNGIWTAQRPSKIAVLAVGYADGFLRALGNAATARFDDIVVPLVGRVSMDLTTYDVTDLPQLAPGDELELIGPSHDADALAFEAGTNGYEILTSLGRRYQRRYLGN
jgi:alanine racemase